jgi:hypothetical protein
MPYKRIQLVVGVCIEIENGRVQALYKDDRIIGKLRPPTGLPVNPLCALQLPSLLCLVYSIYHIICVIEQRQTFRRHCQQ